MSDSNSLIDLKGIEKPLDTLVKKVSSAIGVLYEPTRIKRQARAEAAIKVIEQAEAFGLSEKEVRALRRVAYFEQKNEDLARSIIAKSAEYLGSDAKPQELNDDWIVNFFDKVKFASSEEMQFIWAKILAEESNKPGTFSKRAVNLVSTLDKEDVDDFLKLARFVIEYDNDYSPTIYSVHDSIYQKNGVTYDVLFNLESIGLILLSHSSSYSFDYIEGAHIKYFDTEIAVDTGGTQGILLGVAILTKVAREIMSIINVTPIENYSEHIIRQLTLNGADVRIV